jgi:hypothetical protein
MMILIYRVSYVARIYIGIPPIDNEQFTESLRKTKTVLKWNSDKI